MIRYSYFLSVFCSFAILASCIQHTEPRRPVEQKSGSFLKESIEKNRVLNKEEEAFIKEIIKKDSLNEYHQSKSGFWYTYVIKSSDRTEVPEYGDRVSFEYNLSDILGNEILSKEAIGEQIYLVDQSNQDLISGIREGLKLMHVGETVKFLFPSYKAYGYYGYENHIGPNTPLQCIITLYSIDKSKPKINYEEN